MTAKVDDMQHRMAADVAAIEKMTKEMQANCKLMIRMAQARLRHAEQELPRFQDLRDQLADKRQSPEGAYYFASVDALCRVFEGMGEGAMIAIELSEHNLKVLERGDHDAVGQLRSPKEHLGFLTSRARYALAMASYLWLQYANGVDVLLRATTGETAIDAGSPEEEATRAGWAEALRQAMRSDRELFRLVGQIGTDLSGAQALIGWARGAFEAQAGLPAEARLARLRDPDWEKLNGSLTALSELPEKLKPYPVLSRFFQPADQLDPAAFEALS